MRAGFYPKLALDGIRKNRRMYLPYILTCIGMVMMYYIILFLQYCDAVSLLRGASTVQEMLGLGGWVIGIFSCIFLFYTNSFLIRRRKAEFGLYNILGMGKSNIARVLFWETLIVAAISLGVGLAAGIAFSKLAQLGLVNVMRGDVDYTLSLSPIGISMTVSVFGAIFVLLLLNSIRQVRFTSAVSLLRSENAGDKPPKGNWFLGILGAALLGIAYYMAVTIREPLAAINAFFLAVLMVIVGTYLLMIAGSVLFCRVLQKKKNYYYRPDHFVSVSSMAYRMKRNGAGLASICILATMVLVMISSTTCLYFGEESALNNRYPREINMEFHMWDGKELSDEQTEVLKEDIYTVVRKHKGVPQNDYDFRYAYVSGMLQGTEAELDVRRIEAEIDFSAIRQFYFVPLADYNRIENTHETLADGEALLYVNRGDYKGDTISFRQGNTFKIKKRLEKFGKIGGMSVASITTSMILVVPNLESSISGIDALADYNGNQMLSVCWICNFDTGLDVEEQKTLYEELGQTVGWESSNGKYGDYNLLCECREIDREDFYGLYGGLFYLGVLLSIVFLFAAVLIIYYKQISEGYEDQKRFEIMQKVGMTKQEIRRSINSQLLTVFFLPLVFAAIHVAFAFPIICKLLLMFNLSNVALFAGTTAISMAVFALFYTLVYRITSNAYYKIVSEARK